MSKYITLFMLSLLLLNAQNVFAKQKDTLAQPSNTQSYSYDVDEDFSFDENSYTISNEQLEDAQDIDKIEDKDAKFDDKVINSSHFSAGTATRTWIPINKIK